MVEKINTEATLKIHFGVKDHSIDADLYADILTQLTELNNAINEHLNTKKPLVITT